MTLDQVESEMRAGSSRFAGLGAVVKFDFGADGALFVDGTKAPPAISRDGADPRTTISISLENFVKMNQGQLNPMMAFSTGKLKVSGDMGLAMKLSSMLDD